MLENARSWQAYPITYRSREIQTIIRWIAAGESGSVVGLAGCGRASLLNFLAHRPDVLKHYLPAQADHLCLVPLDVYNLPTADLSTLYRAILHALYWVRERFEPGTAQTVSQVYEENRAVQDPFLPRTALYDLLLLLRQQKIQIVLILNRFDRFCEIAPLSMVNTLRQLRDDFKTTLFYLVGMMQEAAYLPDPATLGTMYELLDTHICWVGELAEEDAQYALNTFIQHAPTPPTTEEVAKILKLAGRFPTLIKVVGQWWLMADHRPADLNDWSEALLDEHSTQFRLERIWNGLTQEEKLALAEVQKLHVRGTRRRAEDSSTQQQSATLGAQTEQLKEQQERIRRQLQRKGLCQQTRTGWQLTSELLNAYIARLEGRIRGRIWIDESTRIIYQGQQAIEELTGIQYDILRFLTKNPRTRHTRDDVIDNAWPEEDQREGITPNALQVHIASIRKKIEPNPAVPRYLLTWHGRPGGYQFFPEGKPE